MVIELLEKSEALLKGHFLLSSGKHSDGYVQCAKLLQYPDRAEEGLKEVVARLKELEIDIVVGPAMGGIVVAYELGRQLGKPAIFTERVDDKMTVRRGFEIGQGDKVLIAEDVVTTGKSAFEAIEAVEKLGGEVVAIASLVDRTDGSLEIPLYSATKVKINTFDPADCPLCKAGEELIKPGSRKIK